MLIWSSWWWSAALQALHQVVLDEEEDEDEDQGEQGRQSESKSVAREASSTPLLTPQYCACVLRRGLVWWPAGEDLTAHDLLMRLAGDPVGCVAAIRRRQQAEEEEEEGDEQDDDEEEDEEGQRRSSFNRRGE